MGAVALIGAGIVAERFGAGTGLSGLGAGIQSIVAAPGTGVGLGLSGTATGLRDIGESIGDIGRGFSDLFAAIPKLPFSSEAKPPGYGQTNADSGNNIGDSGGGSSRGVFAVGEAWTFKGADKLFVYKEKAEKRYKEFLAGEWGSGVNV